MDAGNAGVMALVLDATAPTFTTVGATYDLPAYGQCMSTWEERMAARTRDRREIVETAERIARDAREAALLAEAKAETDRLRSVFLAAHPDLDPNLKWAIIDAPTQICYTPPGNPYGPGELRPYDPADYAWTEDEVWAGVDDVCRECVVATPPGTSGACAHFGWSLMQTCHFQCGHEHHKDEVWIG
jgi:hypothetical protein